jgi:hypothetical protein
MLSVHEHLAGRRLDLSVSKASPGTRFASYKIADPGSNCCRDGKRTSRKSHLTVTVVAVVVISRVSKRPYQNFIQLGVGKLKTVRSWRDTNAGRWRCMIVRQPNTCRACMSFQVSPYINVLVRKDLPITRRCDAPRCLVWADVLWSSHCGL